MAQLRWHATRDGWRSGSFHIRGDADGGWTRSIEEQNESDADGHTVSLVTIPNLVGGPMSLEACKQAAERYARGVDRSRRMRRHAIRSAGAGAGFLYALALPGWWTFPAAIVLAYVALREGMAFVDVLSDRAAEHGSEAYQ